MTPAAPTPAAAASEPARPLELADESGGGARHRPAALTRGGRDDTAGEHGARPVAQDCRDLRAADVEPGDDITRAQRGDIPHQRPPSPAIAMPFTRCFCSTITSTVVGTIEMIEAAIWRSHRVPCSPENDASPIGSVPCDA